MLYVKKPHAYNAQPTRANALSDKERSILLKAYKDDRMKDAPANISDKTLIENYGTNEQKKLLSGFTPTEPAPKGTENKASENKGANPEPPANGGETGSGDDADKGSEEEDRIKVTFSVS